MIGPSPTAHGGMASVVGALVKAGYRPDNSCLFIPTHVDGGTARKAWVATVALAKFVRLLASGRVQLLHAHVASGVSFWRKSLFIALAHLYSCPVVFHLHGGEFREFLSRQDHRLWHRFPNWIIKRSACIFALTSDMARWLGIRYANARIEVFPNPVMLVATQRAESSTSTEILFLGRVDEKKGIFDLLRAMALLRKKVPEAQLTVAGLGDIQSARALATELAMEEAVRFVGWADEATRLTLLARAAILVLPSHHEQMPMVVLEAMASGLPVVASRVGALGDMLDEGACGILVSPGDIEELATAMASALNDRLSAVARAVRAKERARNIYASSAVLGRLRHRYQEIIE